MARITTEQIECFASDADILALASELRQHLGPGNVATKYKVSVAVAKRRLQVMQERGLVKRMPNGCYCVTRENQVT